MLLYFAPRAERASTAWVRVRGPGVNVHKGTELVHEKSTGQLRQCEYRARVRGKRYCAGSVDETFKPGALVPAGFIVTAAQAAARDFEHHGSCVGVRGDVTGELGGQGIVPECHCGVTHTLRGRQIGEVPGKVKESAETGESLLSVFLESRRREIHVAFHNAGAREADTEDFLKEFPGDAGTADMGFGRHGFH